jgi:hypothetical protein
MSKPSEIDAFTLNEARKLRITFEPGTTPALAKQTVANARVTPELEKEAVELGVDITGLSYGPASREVAKERGKAAKAIITKGKWVVGTVLKLDGKILLVTRIERGSGKVGYREYGGVKLVETASNRPRKGARASKTTQIADIDLRPLWETKPLVYATELRGAVTCRVADLRIS